MSGLYILLFVPQLSGKSFPTSATFNILKSLIFVPGYIIYQPKTQPPTNINLFQIFFISFLFYFNIFQIFIKVTVHEHLFQHESFKASRICLSVSTVHRPSTTHQDLSIPPFPLNKHQPPHQQYSTTTTLTL